MNPYPLARVYVHWSDPTIDNGAEHITRLMYPHDGAQQAVNEALATLDFASRPSVRVREIEVYTIEQPRVFYVEPVTTRTLQTKERP